MKIQRKTPPNNLKLETRSAPPVYSPAQGVRQTLQQKPANNFKVESRPAPPVYSPAQGVRQTLQPKPANNFKVESRPAPPVYRPTQSGASTTQAKSPDTLPKATAVSPSYSSLQLHPQYELDSPMWVGSGRQQIRMKVKDSPVPIGSVDVHYRQGQNAFISHLHVAEAHRQHGVGTMLMKAAMDSARRNGSTGTELEANPGPGSISKQALVSMYQKMGFKSSGLTQRGNPRMSVQRKAALSAMITSVVQRADAAPAADEVLCTICQDAIAGGGVQTPCHHDFHQACLNTWMADSQNLAGNYRCPVCNASHAATVGPSAANHHHHPPAAAFGVGGGVVGGGAVGGGGLNLGLGAAANQGAIANAWQGLNPMQQNQLINQVQNAFLPVPDAAIFNNPGAIGDDDL
jgi:ribosomal protein S18 acetylase RimI-like enzyme